MLAATRLALRDLVAQVERVGGYASGKDQDALCEAERVLAGGGR